MAVHRNRRRRWLIGLGAVLVVVLGIRLALDPIVRWQTRKRLDAVQGVRVDFLDASLSLFPLEYRIARLKIVQPNARVKEPIFYADQIAIRLGWGKLLTGRLVAQVEASGAKVVLIEPKPGGDAKLPGLDTLIPVPVVFERVHAVGGEVLYVWVHQKNQPTLWFNDIEATLENLGSRADLVRGPTTLDASGRVEKQGRMTAHVTINPWADEPTFVARTELSGFQVSALNNLIDSQKGVKLAPGVFATKMSFDVKAGRVTGKVAPSLKSEGVASSGNGLGSGLRALLAKATMSLAPHAEGTNPDGTIRVQDDVSASKQPLILIVERVVEHGFLLGLEEGLKRVHSGGTKPAGGKPGKATPLGAGT